MLSSAQNANTQYTLMVVLFLLEAFDEPREPTALGLTWSRLFSSADVEPQ
jgi:hypothetical protein